MATDHSQASDQQLQPSQSHPPPERGRPRWRLLRLRGADVGLVYGTIVVGLGLALAWAPTRFAGRFVVHSSTNLANLRLHPLFVLFVSAFVESSLPQLLLVPVLIGAYTAVQRWLGRAAAIVTGVFGHVGATLGVATVLTVGIAHGRIALSVAHVADVGVSYGLVTVFGLLTAHVPRPWRGAYAAALSAVLAVLLVLDRSFTDLGHALAWLIGLGLALLVTRAFTSTAPNGHALPTTPTDPETQ